MTVWRVYISTHNGEETIGIFSTRDKAIKESETVFAAEYKHSSDCEVMIDEWRVQ